MAGGVAGDGGGGGGVGGGSRAPCRPLGHQLPAARLLGAAQQPAPGALFIFRQKTLAAR